MLYRVNLTTIIICLALLLGAGPIAADPPGAGDGTDTNNRDAIASTPLFAPDQVVVGFSARSSGAAAASYYAIKSLAAALTSSNVFLYQLEPGQDPQAVAEELEGLPGATFAHPNYLLNELHPVQGSLAFSDQVASGDFDDQPAAQLLNLTAAHLVVTGDQVTLGIVDGGIDCAHPGLSGRAVDGYDFVDNDAVAMDEPGGTTSGHGTFAAGIAHLVAPDAALRAYRVMDANGRGDGFTLARAIERAVQDGCDVINLSVVLTHQHLAVQAAIEQAVAEGAIVIGAAGNEHTDTPIYPAAEAAAVAVAAVDDNLQATDFTNFGFYIDVCAPGLDVYSAYQGDLFAWWSGTSFATPFVSGQAALLRERYPNATVAELKESIVSTAFSVDDLNPNLSGWLGSGLVGIAPSVRKHCCELPGDVNGNGIAFELADEAALTYALAGGGPSYLGDCIGNSDIDGNCRIDLADLFMLSSMMVGDTVVVGECGSCPDYEFIPSGPDQHDCCELPGDVNGNGIAFEVPDETLLASALDTGNPAYLDSCMGNANLNDDCLIDAADLALMRAVINGEIVPDFECYRCNSYELVPNATDGTCCELTGDVNGNGIAYELTDEMLLASALDTGDPDYIDACIGNADLTGDCRIDADDLALLRLAIMGDTMPVLGCASCAAYEFLPNPPTGVACCVLPGDLDDDGAAFTLIDLVAFDTALATGNPAYLGDCLGNADLSGDCIIDSYDLVLMAQRYLGDTLAAIECAACEAYAFHPDTVQVDPAWVSPYSQAVAAPWGVDSTTPASVYLGTSAGALPYTATVKGHPGVVNLAATGGLTNSHVLFDVVSTADLDSGLYVDTITFHVDGATNNPVIAIVYLAVDCCQGHGTARALPYAQAFGAPPDEPHTRAGTVVLTSTNAPAPYTVSVLGTADFTQLITTAGMTNDSVMFYVTTGDGLPAGVYIDTLAFEVAGAAPSPTLALLFLEVKESTEPDSGMIRLLPGEFFAAEGEDLTQTGNLVVIATGLPKNFTVAQVDEPEFLHLLDSAGSTGEPTPFEVTSTAGMAPGVYVDSVIAYIDDVSNSPIYAAIYLYVDSLGGGPTGDTAYVYVVPGSFFVAPLGEDQSQSGTLVIGAGGEPKAFTVESLNYGGFVNLHDNSGTTGDSVVFDVISTADMAAGVYVDSLHIEVADVDNSPLLAVIFLNIGEDTVVVGGDSITVNPDQLAFEAEAGSPDTLEAYLHVFSTNSPAGFTVYALGGFDTFVEIPDSLSTTPDSVLIQVIPDGLPVGVYYDTVVVAVDGFYQSARVPVTLTIVPAAPAPASDLALANHPNPFNPETEIEYSLPSASQVVLNVYNILGREVITLVDENQPAGVYTVVWNGRDESGYPVASGVYLYRLQAGSQAATRKMLLLK